MLYIELSYRASEEDCSTLAFKFEPGGTRSLIQFGFLLFSLLTYANKCIK